MDLNLETLRTRGRARKLTAAVERPLREADLRMLEVEKGVAPAPIAKIRERHHALARCLADGLSEAEAAIACGYSASRISILKADPTFQELVKFYTSEVNERYFGLHDAMAELGVDSVRELQDRLEESPDEFTVKELREIAAFAADRTGHGPSSKQEVSHTVNFGERLEAARQRIIDITPKKLDHE